MTKWVTVSAHTLGLIADCRTPGAGFNSQATALDDGNYRVPLGDDTYERIREMATSASEPDESVILRAVSAFAGGSGKLN